MSNLDGAPWFEPPPWWKDGLIDGLAWEDLLQREWTRAVNEPLTPRELEVREMCRKMGRAAALDRQTLAIEVLATAMDMQALANEILMGEADGHR